MDEDWALMASFFPATWRELAVETDAVKGLRKDKSPDSLLRILLMHLACGYSLRETAVRAHQGNLADLTDVALLKRLRKSGDWLQRLCVSLFQERGVRVGADGGVQFRLFDATDVKEPGKTGSLWRIHYGLRVPSLTCDFFKLTETEGPGTGESFCQFPVQPGDHIIADRGYCTAAGIHYVASCKAFLSVRVNSAALPMKTPTGEKFDLIPHLQALTTSGDIAEWKVLIPAPNEGTAVAGRLCAIRKTKDAIRRAHNKLRRKASKKGHRLQVETLLAAEYVAVFTTFSETLFPAAEVLQWYRVRWQVELVFKRFKQIARLGHLPKYDEASAKAWLYGKLFVALVTEKMVTHAAALSPWHTDLEPGSIAECLA